VSDPKHALVALWDKEIAGAERSAARSLIKYMTAKELYDYATASGDDSWLGVAKEMERMERGRGQ
jgi:hypothetical protein